MTLIVVGAILVIGFKLIGNVTQKSSQIDYIKFQRTLINSIDAVASDYNARQRIELSVPKGTEALCFINTQTGSTTGDYPLVDAYWSDTEYMNQPDREMVRNAFLIGNDFLATFHIDKLVVDTGHLCIEPQRTRMEFWAEGKGRTVKITSP